MAAALPVLGKYQLFRIIGRLMAQGFSGNLFLEPPEGRTTFVFDAGVPVLAHSTEVALSFPAFLLRKRRIERQRLKELLEEAASRGSRLEDLLVSRGLLTGKDVLRLRRELSVFVFSISFLKEQVPYRVTPGSAQAGEEEMRIRHPLEPHDALFRAVVADKDMDYMGQLFREHWHTQLTKTADFYRYLIQYRSVFYGEDVSELLMEPEVTAQRVLDSAADKESALKQLFSLCLSGMLTFEVAGETQPREDELLGAEPGAAQEVKTILIVPDEGAAAPITRFVSSYEAPQPAQEKAAAPVPPPPPEPEPDELHRFLAEGFSQTPELKEPDAKPMPEVPPAARAQAEPEARPEPEEPEMTDEDEMAKTLRLSVLPAAFREEEEEIGEDAPAGVRRPVAMALMPQPEAAAEPARTAPLSDARQEARPDTRTPRPVITPVHDDGMERLLEQAMQEAEKAVADGKTAAPAPARADEDDELPLPRPKERATPAPQPAGKPSPLALTEPAPVPERPSLPDAGTDENIERILEDVYRSMLSRSFYEILGVTPFSPLSTVRDAAARLKIKYGPDRYVGYMLSNRGRMLLEYVGREIDRARTVLTDATERALYDNRVSTDYGQDRRVALSFLFEAEDCFQKGQKEADAERWIDALMLFTRAAETNPRDPEYLASKGWATYQALKSGQSGDNLAPEKARNILQRALAVDPRHVRAMLYIARIERETGNNDSARVWFERLHKIDPTNDEVAAALDWLRMSPRLEKRPEESGVWGRIRGLFKKQ